MQLRTIILALSGLVSLATVAATDANAPILPGWGKHYWNVASRWYIHPPAFDFGGVKGAAAYRFRVVADGASTNFFTAASPKAALVPVWTKLPRKGFVKVVCEGLDASGKPLGVAGEAQFWKSAPFTPGAYAPAARPYGDAAARCYDYILKMPALRHLAEKGKPDFGYTLNCYPSKMNASIVNLAVGAMENDPSKRDEMLKLARAAADYLISTAEPADAPLAYFTQTYSKESQKVTAKEYQGQHMLIYPAGAASAFLRLYKASGARKYLEAAERIAGTYLKLQGADGTWYLKMWAKDGRPVNPNRLTPMGVIGLFESLYAETKNPAYRTAADRAFAFVEKGPLADWNWEGQFEDVAPSKPYRNLTKHTAVDVAMYLLKRYPDDRARVAQARTLVDFAEDQFVAWEKPCRADGFSYPEYKGAQAVTNWWCFPTVMEQYNWYVPTDASSAKMIRGYLALYAVEKDPVDLAKAKALGDGYTRAQQSSGRIPTQWMGDWFVTDHNSDWINCMIASANTLAELAKVAPSDALFEKAGAFDSSFVSPKLLLDKEPETTAYYKLTFSAKSPVDGYWWVDFYDRTNTLLPDVNSRLYASADFIPYEVVVPACPSAVTGEIKFSLKKPHVAEIRDLRAEKISVDEAFAWCARTYAAGPQLGAVDVTDAWTKLPNTKKTLTEGTGRFDVVLLGDSLMNDSYCGLLGVQLQKAFPNIDFRIHISVRGSTGCWYYHEKDHFEDCVAKYHPQLVLIGGISNCQTNRFKRYQANPKLVEDDMVETIVRSQALGAEVIVCTPPKSVEFRKSPAPQELPANFNDEVTAPDYLQLAFERRAAARTGAQVWELNEPTCRTVARSGKPLGWFNRDFVHNDDRGKQLIARVFGAYFRALSETMPIELSGWKGETVSFRFEKMNAAGGAYAPRWDEVPDGWPVKGGVMRGVRYMTKVHGTEHAVAPDRVEWNGATNLPPVGSCIAVGQVTIPYEAKAGDYALAFGGRTVKLHVADRMLPPPGDWGYWLAGFWHHPWALARVTKTRPWSKEHFDAMRPFLADTAAMGLKTIMCTICDLPWNHQCYDPNWTMVRHIRHGGKPGYGGIGKWSFDYTIFDKWVEFNLATGNGPVINCYALCPWDYELWYHDESGRPWHFNAKPGTKEYEAYWTPFLIDFRKHLIEKGWFDKTYLAADERKPEDVRAYMDLLRRVAPDFHVNASCNGDPSAYRGFKLGSYDQILSAIDGEFLARIPALRAEGRKTSYYVCCVPEKPNTFVSSDPDDAFWLAVFPVTKGMDGFSRWTFDSFPENAMEDATYACWPSGDTYFVYPNGDPSWRYLCLLNGVQNAEKWRILASEGGAKAAELEKLAPRYDVHRGLRKHDGDFRDLIAETLDALNDLKGDR